MSGNLFPYPGEDRTNYIAALEVIAEASQSGLEAHIQSSGANLVRLAEQITYRSGVHDPERVVKTAEQFTFIAGVVEPTAVIKAAEKITRDDAEIVGAGENLADEEVLSTDIADRFQAYLYTKSANFKSLTEKQKKAFLELSEVASLEEREEVIRRNFPHHYYED